MQASHYFLSKVKQAKKYKYNNPDFNEDSSIADYFVRIIGLPKPMANELYDSYGYSYDLLAYTIDFFHNELDISLADQFSSSDWSEIKSLIDRYAKKYEIRNLQEMMQYLLDIGQL